MGAAVMGWSDRRAFLRRSTALGGLGLLGGCATAGGVPAPGAGFRPEPALAPVKAEIDRIIDITVCLRPFRAAGPRLDTEMVGDKLVVHNYGHGGSGWSLSWGSGLIAVKTALERGERDIAVIGGGALGLTAATLAQRAGANVTIYAREWMPDVRSSRATGVWSPDSRIALESGTGAGFPAFWEQMARNSFRIHQRYLGFADGPVAWQDRYSLSDEPPHGPEPDPLGFVRLGERILDLTPRSKPVDAAVSPFKARYARKAVIPVFNIMEYGHMLMTDFLVAGGKRETREFHSPAELASLPQKVIINCPGYGARALWKDESIVPVRGQLAWLIPQPEVTYGVSYHNVGTVSRRDGLIVQKYGADDSYGYNDANETPDRAEAEEAVRTIAAVFSPGRAAAA